MTASSDLGYGQDISSKVKNKLLHLALPTPKKDVQHQLGVQFQVGPSVREGSAIGPSCVPAALPLELFDPKAPLIFDMSMTDREVVWDPWHDPLGELLCRPLGFWSKAMSSSKCKHCPFKK